MLRSVGSGAELPGATWGQSGHGSNHSGSASLCFLRCRTGIGTVTVSWNYREDALR